MNNLPTWLTIILAPGAAGLVWVVFKGTDLWRNGTAAQEARAIRNLEKYADRESFRADRNADLVDYYRDRVGVLEWVIRNELGPDKVPARLPLPPMPARHAGSRNNDPEIPRPKN